MGSVDRQGSGGDDSRVEIWKRVAPPTGTHDVVITFSADLLFQAVGGVITFTGVDPIDPLGAFAGDYADSSAASLTVPSASGELVLGVFSCEKCNSVAFTSPVVEQWELSREPTPHLGTHPLLSDGRLTPESFRPGLRPERHLIQKSLKRTQDRLYLFYEHPILRHSAGSH